jgi:predicted DNA-binding transcriptional regulator AlpA
MRRKRLSKIVNSSKPVSRKRTGSEVVRTSPLRLIRPTRLARLLDCDPSIVWRYMQDGTLPAPIVIAGIKGWPETELLEWMKARRSKPQRESRAAR